MLRKIVQGTALAGVVLGLGAAGGGCLNRNVDPEEPTVNTNFTNTVSQSGIDKVDILFDIDNSASMGDKQQFLIDAIPDMITRLVTPRCVDAMGVPIPGVISDDKGVCTSGSAEFAPVHNMHIGVVTSALGTRLGCAQLMPGNSGVCAVYVCDPGTKINAKAGYSVSSYNDDSGHLINRSEPNGNGAPLAEAQPSNFLYWYPTTAANSGGTAMPGASPIVNVGAPGSPDTLNGDFTELVGGAGQSGCGIESQLESWYRFLIQPDPYQSLVVDPKNGATWVGVDSTIIQQRHDFLRPDSLVAIIVLTDENDSEIDVRSYEGTGYQFMSQTWPPPPGTSACQQNATGPNTGPTDPKCQSCGFANALTKADPMCNGTLSGGYTAPNDWGANLNLRHVHMLGKYGLNPQFPLTRYFNGLTSKTVPNRTGEYPSVGSYVGNNNCTNPLFANPLPPASAANNPTALCNLTVGARSPQDVFYAHIGGVPHQLLQSQPGVPDPKTMAIDCPAGTAQVDCPQKDEISSQDWVKILGQGPAAYTSLATGSFPSSINYDYTGIDPHMLESYAPRTQLGTAAAPGTVAPNMTSPAISAGVSTGGLPGGLIGPAFGTGANPISPDPINGREWVTNAGNHSLPVDRQYACTFQLPPKDQRDCSTLGSASMNTVEYNSCDCQGLMDTPDQVPPLCAKTSSDGTITSSVNDYTVQVYAKAYPTVRELMLANMMGPQGIVSSLCPIHTVDNATNSDPLYGYRPAVNAIVNRLKNALAAQCVPALTPVQTDAGLQVPCLILVTFPPAGTGGAGPGPGECDTFNMPAAYASVNPTVLTQYQTQQHATWLLGAADGGTPTTDPSTLVTCQLRNQIATTTTSCVGNSTPGWCYVTNSSACAAQGGDALVFTSNFIPNGATVNLQCIAANASNATDGSVSGGGG